MCFVWALSATEAGFIEPVLVGDADEIVAIAREASWDISAFRLVAADGEAQAAEFAAALARGR